MKPQGFRLSFLWMDEIHFAPPKKKLVSDVSPAITNKRHGLLWFLRWCEMDFVQPPTVSANAAILPKPEIRNPQVKGLYHSSF